MGGKKTKTNFLILPDGKLSPKNNEELRYSLCVVEKGSATTVFLLRKNYL